MYEVSKLQCYLCIYSSRDPCLFSNVNMHFNVAWNR